MILREWAAQWGISAQAIYDLERRYGIHGITTALPADTLQKGESATQQEYRFEAARRGELLWRNNKGVLPDARGVPVRFGLCNDTPQVGEQFRSSDLIGAKPLLIEQKHVGLVVAQFKARELKKPGWRYTGTEHERGQLNYIELVNAKGGDAAFATGPDWG